MRLNRIPLILIIYILLAGCSSGPQATPIESIQVDVKIDLDPTPTPAAVEEAETEAPELAGLAQQSFVAFPGGGAVDFTFDAAGRLYLAYGQDGNVFLVQSQDGGATFGEAVSATTAENVFVYPLERPALAVGPEGRVHVAWPENAFPGRIWYAYSDDGGSTFSESQPLSEQGQETVLVRLALQPDGSPLAAWLQSSQLHFTRSDDGGSTYPPDQTVDDQTCDCCHPQPLLVDGELFIAYRNLIIDDQGRNIRDIYVVHSPDGGETFEEPVRVSDAPWYISACPFSGPSMITDEEGNLYVSWMDGRNDINGTLSRTDIWLAVSTDGGQTFSANRRLSPDAGVYSNLPSIALDTSGRLHAIWQTDESTRDVLYYTFSDDRGETFAPPQAIVDSTENGGNPPANASLYVSEDGTVYVSWVDRAGAYIGSWR